MQGDTTFHFVTDGIHAALDAAKKAAGNRDVRIGGGAGTVRQYLQAGLVDEVHLALSPTLLGQGEALLAGIDLTALASSALSTSPRVTRCTSCCRNRIFAGYPSIPPCRLRDLPLTAPALGVSTCGKRYASN
jgi:dihydrofolate reductase